MAETSEQNPSEAPTPFKLAKAREKGSVARSTELGFLAGLLALASFAMLSGERLMTTLARAMRIALAGGFGRAGDPQAATGMLGELYWAALAPLLLLGGTVVGIVILFEIVQLRGLIFTAHPLKPDWSRLNPGKGLKRLFSVRMFKDTLKSLAKFALYVLATWLVLRSAIAVHAEAAGDGQRLAPILYGTGLRLLFAFALVAVAIAILDQLLVRGEFTKQMRMSRREVTRETREREGEPRIKRRRKQLHQELGAQGKGSLAGADMLIVNPEHFAVALRYDEERMIAPEVAIKGRNAVALTLREEAHRRGVAIVADPPLARALYRACAIGDAIPADRFEAVAALYIDLRRAHLAPQQD